MPESRGGIGRWWPLALVLGAGAVVLLRGLGASGLWEPWEPFHAQVAREAGQQGWFGGTIAPPLAHWGMLAGSAVLGMDERGLRIVGALLALLTLLIVAYVVERLRGRGAALIAAAVLLSSPLFYFLARQATPEIYVLATTGSALLLFCLALLRPGERRTAHCVAGALALALALLAASPLVALAAVALPFLLYGVSRIGAGSTEPRRHSSGSTWTIAVVVAVAVVTIAAPWYVTTIVRHGNAGELLLTVQPTPLVTDQPGGFDYYFRGFIFGFFPWSCLLPLALVLLAPAWREGIDAHAFEICLLLSGLATFVVINTGGDRFPQALAPAAVPTAVLLGITIDRLRVGASPAGARVGWALATLLYLPTVVDLRKAGGLRYLLGSFTTERDVPKEFDPGALFVVLPLIFALLLLVSIVSRSRLLVPLLAVVALALAVRHTGTLVPALSEQKSLKAVFAAWPGPSAGAAHVGFLGEVRPGARFYGGEALLLLADAAAFMDHMNPARPAFAIVSNEDVLRVDQAYRERYPGHRLRLVHRSRAGYILLSNGEPAVSP